jgi:hypothetical protein
MDREEYYECFQICEFLIRETIFNIITANTWIRVSNYLLGILDMQYTVELLDIMINIVGKYTMGVRSICTFHI